LLEAGSGACGDAVANGSTDGVLGKLGRADSAFVGGGSGSAWMGSIGGLVSVSAGNELLAR
jgi:hypothetical protein